ncbi:hypothetical protein [Rhodopseudomonas palustris]|uniref:hypothetical protein n=1 Tax=Rhodopseudomonas palustris TaxID=1076 RepID=UPI0021F37122|nr:hypothetical protein [Rhodopseudomonas palustris]
MTIEDLLRQGAIRRIEVDLGAGAQPARLLYGTPNFIEWLENLLGAQSRSRGSAKQPLPNKSTRCFTPIFPDGLWFMSVNSG